MRLEEPPHTSPLKNRIDHLFCLSEVVSSLHKELLHSGWHQPQKRDLRRRAQANGRSPVAGSPADIDFHAVEFVKAGNERLVEADHVVPREELAAVGVARDLEIETRLGRVEHTLGLMGQQDFQVRVGCAGNGIPRA